MSTTPVTPVVNPAPQMQALNPGRIRTFLFDHEYLLMAILAAALIWFVSGKIENIIAAHDNANLQAQKLVTEAQVRANQQLAVQVQTDAENLKALQDKFATINAQLAQANTTLAAALANRQKTDAALPLPDLAIRWHEILPGASPAATPTGVSLDSLGAHATVSALEQIQPLKDQLANETTMKNNGDALLAAANTSILDLNKRVDGLNLTIVDNTKQCKDEKKVMTDQFRKSKRRWFIVGYVAGFISRQAILSYTGH